MGAINFGTLTNKSRLALVNEQETNNGDYYDDFYFELEEVDETIKNKNFYYFNLLIKYGYYNGFYLKLEDDNTKYIYENTKEKQEVLKELTQIKKILVDFVKNGFLWGCYPSWVYSKLEKKETLTELRKIIKELKEETKKSYTQRTAKKQNKNIFDIIKEG
jgi:hypothetical protein